MEQQNIENGLTIAEVAEKLGDSEVDVDVYDTEVDMGVAFCYDIGDTSDSYFKFLDLLSRKVKVVKVQDYSWVCDFSGYFKQFNDDLIKLREEYGWPVYEFEEEETYYDFVLMLESLISGNATDSSYAQLLSVLR